MIQESYENGRSGGKGDEWREGKREEGRWRGMR
jgi:hypothetical protein